MAKHCSFIFVVGRKWHKVKIWIGTSASKRHLEQNVIRRLWQLVRCLRKGENAAAAALLSYLGISKRPYRTHQSCVLTGAVPRLLYKAGWLSTVTFSFENVQAEGVSKSHGCATVSDNKNPIVQPLQLRPRSLCCIRRHARTHKTHHTTLFFCLAGTLETRKRSRIFAAASSCAAQQRRPADNWTTRLSLIVVSPPSDNVDVQRRTVVVFRIPCEGTWAQSNSFSMKHHQSGVWLKCWSGLGVLCDWSTAKDQDAADAAAAMGTFVRDCRQIRFRVGVGARYQW